LAKQSAFTASPSIGLPVVRPKKKLKALHWDKVDSPLTTHWAAHAPSAEEREEKYLELSRKGILDEVEKLFMAKEIKRLGQGNSKKDDKKQIISNDLRKAFGKNYKSGLMVIGTMDANMRQKLHLQSSRSTLWIRWCK
jgi:cytokinesis protein